MVGFSRKAKSSKLRGSREHGRGKKKGRGAGLRGGRGNAGRHKHKRVHYEQLGLPFGVNNIGFKRPDEAIEAQLAINISDLDEAIESWVAEGKAQKVDGGFAVDLAALGYDKLLGSGQAKNAIKVTVATATERATSKIEEAGGQVVAPAAQ
ncbi:MAG: uL15m family ribosomal protein [Thermoplasmatota archaeon]